MVCFAAYGERVEDYEREIREAQAAGIDGFALNCGAWHDEPHYPRRAKAIYQAAKELGNGFKLFFSVDFAGLQRHPPGEFESYVLDMVKTYGHHPNQFMVDGRTVVSTFGGEEGMAWKRESSLRSRRPDITSSSCRSFPANNSLPFTATARPFLSKTGNRSRIGSSVTTTFPRAGLPTPGRDRQINNCRIVAFRSAKVALLSRSER